MSPKANGRPFASLKAQQATMGELQYAQPSGDTCIFFYVETFIGDWTNADFFFLFLPYPGLNPMGNASLHSSIPFLTLF